MKFTVKNSGLLFEEANGVDVLDAVDKLCDLEDVEKGWHPQGSELQYEELLVPDELCKSPQSFHI